MKKQSGLVFERSITRDWGIIYGELWHRVFTEEFKKQIGWGYSEVIFEGKDNTISIYRTPEEHIRGMREHILKQLDNDPEWLQKRAEIVKKQVDNVLLWSKNTKRTIFKYNNLELSDIIRKFMRDNLDLGPNFIIMLWFPIQMEEYKRVEQYKFAVDKAIQTREYIEKVGPLIDEFGRLLGLEVAKRTNISQTLSKYICYEELLNYFEKGIKPDVKTLRRRKKYFIITNKGILYESLFDYIKRRGYSVKKTKLKNISEIKGQVAYEGRICGKVQIIKNKNDFNKFKTNNILVTGMTTPDFLPIMKRASAFITDEGGITCHASIVAREMKKVCIIGTKIATEVLKDGDEVEIDTKKSIIKIISRT